MNKESKSHDNDYGDSFIYIYIVFFYNDNDFS